MSDLQALTTLGEVQVSCAVKRTNESLTVWADGAIDVALNGGASDTALAVPTLDHTVEWTKGGRTYKSKVSTTGTQQELDDAVATFKARIAAAGGSVVSG